MICIHTSSETMIDIKVQIVVIIPDIVIDGNDALACSYLIESIFRLQIMTLSTSFTKMPAPMLRDSLSFPTMSLLLTVRTVALPLSKNSNRERMSSKLPKSAGLAPLLGKGCQETAANCTPVWCSFIPAVSQHVDVRLKQIGIKG
jgi:hypothetical protein